ncbi:hypothetical protein ATHL_01077 [Anaerolinea thermolimosa]|nr:hypothetical protein ATHL_01077 [Anaerolinea thermolimosa]
MVGTAGGRPSKTVQICMVSKDTAADLLNVSPRLVATVKAVEREARRFGGPGWPGGLERLSAPQVGGL